jgi:YD repeat-containing protein
VGYRNAQGQALVFQRDESRRLVRLTSPNQSWVRLTYGPANHIAEIDDSRGRNVRYGYDERNRLTTVSYPSGEVFHYEYDDEQHLLTVSVSPDAGAAPLVLLRNEYVNGRVTKQTFANGEVYAYGYYPAGTGQIKMAVVAAPSGKRYLAQITADGSIVRERDTAPASSTQ